MLDFALRLYDQGIVTIPTSMPHKTPPAGLEWGDWKNGVARDKFQSEWAKYWREGMGISVLCGEIELFDIDTKNDPEHSIHTRVYDAMKAHLAPEVFQKLFIQESQSGGYHFWYKVQKVDIHGPMPDLARIEYTEDQRFELCLPVDKSNIGVIVETKGFGGYGVIAPSANYKVLQGSIEDLPRLSTEDRELVLMIGRSFNQYEPEAQVYGSGNYTPSEKGSRPGDIYNQRNGPMELLSLVESYGFRRIKQIGDSIFLGRPGAKHANKHDAKINTRLNCFVNYSSSVADFTILKGYSPFYVYANLAHSGNFVEATKALAAKGYEDPDKKWEGPKTGPKFSDNGEEAEVIEDDDFLAQFESSRFSLKDRPNIKYNLFAHDPYNLSSSCGFGFSGAIIGISGLAKSRKTTVLGCIIAAALKLRRVETFSYADTGKILWIDTEQGDLYFWNTIRRVHVMAGLKEDQRDRLFAYKFVDMTPAERIENTNRLVDILQPTILVVDGLADYVEDIMDAKESSRVMQSVRAWTSKGVTVFPVIHLNPSTYGQPKPRGHLGTWLMNKCDCLIEATTDKDDSNRVRVRNSWSRGQKFPAFEMVAGKDGILYANNPPEYDYTIGGEIEEPEEENAVEIVSDSELFSRNRPTFEEEDIPF